MFNMLTVQYPGGGGGGNPRAHPPLYETLTSIVFIFSATHAILITVHRVIISSTAATAGDLGPTGFCNEQDNTTVGPTPDKPIVPLYDDDFYNWYVAVSACVKIACVRVFSVGLKK